MWNYTEVVITQHSQVDTAESETQETATGIKQNTETVGLHCIITISTHSSLGKLLGVTSFVLRYIRNAKQSTSRSTGPLSAQELHAQGQASMDPQLSTTSFLQRTPQLDLQVF